MQSHDGGSKKDKGLDGKRHTTRQETVAHSHSSSTREGSVSTGSRELFRKDTDGLQESQQNRQPSYISPFASTCSISKADNDKHKLEPALTPSCCG